MRSSDSYLVNVLDKLEADGLFDDTLIVRTADHGEMGLTHGGLRQKNFNFYEESRVPLVYSNPKLFPQPAENRRPRLPRRLSADPRQPGGAPKPARAQLAGVDYSEVVLNPQPTGPGLRRLHLRRLPVGPGERPLPQTPNHVVSIRENRWKLAKYYDVEVAIEGEAGRTTPRTETAPVGDVRPEDRPPRGSQPRLRRLRTDPAQDAQFKRLKKKLDKVQATRLKPLAQGLTLRA